MIFFHEHWFSAIPDSFTALWILKYLFKIHKIDNSNTSTRQKNQIDSQVYDHSSYFCNFELEFSNDSCKINSGSGKYIWDHVFY